MNRHGAKRFLKSTLIAAGSAAIGSSQVYRMIIGARNGNTDHLNEAYIKGLVEKDHTVTKVMLTLCSVLSPACLSHAENLMCLERKSPFRVGEDIVYRLTCDEIVLLLIVARTRLQTIL